MGPPLSEGAAFFTFEMTGGSIGPGTALTAFASNNGTSITIDDVQVTGLTAEVFAIVDDRGIPADVQASVGTFQNIDFSESAIEVSAHSSALYHFTTLNYLSFSFYV